MLQETLQVGSPVRFVSGTYKGKFGTVERLTPQRAHVSSPDMEKLVCVYKTSLHLDSPQQVTPQGTPQVHQSPPQQMQQTPVGPQSATPRRSSRLASNPPQPPSPCQLSSRPGALPLSFGGRPIEKIVLAKELGGKQESSFLKEWLGPRWLMEEMPLPHGSNCPALPELKLQYNGLSYQFVASKVFDNGMEPWGGKKKCLRMVYAEADGISLQGELEKLADWRALPNIRKVASRLELLQSPGEVHTELFGEPLSPDLFELIDEPLTEESGGCGFISQSVLEQLLSGGKERVPIAAKRATSIQVRIFISRKDAAPEDPGGIFKGMLTAKADINNIQLPPSMHKVCTHTTASRP